MTLELQACMPPQVFLGHRCCILCRAWVKTHEIYDKLKAELKKRESSTSHRSASRDRPQDHRSSRDHDRDRGRHDRDRDRHTSDCDRDR